MPSTSDPSPVSKIYNVLLWIAQAFVSVVFLWAGFMKLARPEELPFVWAAENPGLVLITGIVDLLAGIGILFPALLRIQPKLTVYAAYGTIVLMIVAIVFHVLRGEVADIGFNILMLFLAGCIAWGRQTRVPISPMRK